MSEDRPLQMEELRGMKRDERPAPEKPRSPQAYDAMSGVSHELVAEFLAANPAATHGEVVRWIAKEWWSMPDFRRDAIQHNTRHWFRDEQERETRQQRRARLRSEEKSLSKKEKQLEQEQRAVKQGRPLPKSAVSGFVPAGQVVGNYDMPAQRKFFGCEDWSDEDLDTWVEHLKALPGGSWLDGPVRQGDRRVYAMSCIKLQRDDPVKYERLIVKGEMWINYGTEEDADV